MTVQWLETASVPRFNEFDVRWQILCDFDGTITLQDSVVTLLDRFADPTWREIDDENPDTGGSLAARPKQTALVRASRAELDGMLDRLTIDPDFAGFVAETSRMGLPLTVVSDGYDYCIQRVLANAGIRDLEVISHKLLFLDNDRMGVEFPFSDKDCAVEQGTCKCAAMGRLRNRKSVLIGDCTAGAADFVFAKGSLVEHCRQEGIPHRAFSRFAELVPLIPAISGDGTALLEMASS
jgi:2,3-diketo-5-methylthio-1-phosphopentane phosphatase